MKTFLFLLTIYIAGAVILTPLPGDPDQIWAKMIAEAEEIATNGTIEEKEEWNNHANCIVNENIQHSMTILSSHFDTLEDTILKIHHNIKEMVKVRLQTISTLQQVKEITKEKLLDHKIAQICASSLGIAGGGATFLFPPAGLALGITSFLMKIGTDITVSVLSENEKEKAEIALKNDAGIGKTLEGLFDNMRKTLDLLFKLYGINAEDAFTLAKTYSTNKQHFKARNAGSAIMSVLPVLGPILGGSKDIYIDKRDVHQQIIRPISVPAAYVKKAKTLATGVAWIGSKMGWEVASKVDGFLKSHAKAFGGLTIGLEIWQIVSIWTSTENDAVEKLDKIIEELHWDSGEFVKLEKNFDDYFSHEPKKALDGLLNQACI